jgi:nitroreductase
MSTSVLDEQVELHPLLSERWSPRSFHPTHEISDASVASLLEAARWAPSAANTQPWRFIVAKRGTEAFEKVVAALAEGNSSWARSASLLIVTLSTSEVKMDRWAAYDVGQAAAHLSVQAHAIGYHAHQMGGFDPQALRESFSLAETLTPQTVIAIGEAAEAELLPEGLRERELLPRTRLSLDELIVA